MKKRMAWVLGIGIVFALVWYLFVREEDLTARMRFVTYPGTVLQSLRGWSLASDNLEMVGSVTENSLEQRVQFEGRNYHFKWNIWVEEDTLSIVEVAITEPGNSLRNRLLIPWLETPVEKHSQTLLREFYGTLNNHLSQFRVKVEGVRKLDSMFCVYLPVESGQMGKAYGMMANYSFLSSFVVDHDLKPSGVPFVEVTRWDPATNLLAFDFCYPIQARDTLPEHDKLKYKWLKGGKAVKAIYHGNYITSDRAWYAIQHFAHRNDLELEQRPIELFYNNPNLDAEETNWKAEIYFPLVQEN